MEVPEADITLAPDSRTTYQDARFSLPILTRRGTRSALIVSDPFHLPRVRWTFRHVFEGSPIRLFFVPSKDASVPPDWWKKEKSRNLVFLEILKNAYYRFYYGMLGLESEPAWVLEWKAAVKRFFG